MFFFPFLLAETAYKKTPQCHLGKRSILVLACCGDWLLSKLPLCGDRAGLAAKIHGEKQPPHGAQKVISDPFPVLPEQQRSQEPAVALPVPPVPCPVQASLLEAAHAVTGQDS